MMSTNPNELGEDGAAAASSNEFTQKLVDLSSLNEALHQDLKKIHELATASASSDANKFWGIGVKVCDFREEHGAIVTDLEELAHAEPASGDVSQCAVQTASVSGSGMNSQVPFASAAPCAPMSKEELLSKFKPFPIAPLPKAQADINAILDDLDPCVVHKTDAASIGCASGNLTSATQTPPEPPIPIQSALALAKPSTRSEVKANNDTKAVSQQFSSSANGTSVLPSFATPPPGHVISAVEESVGLRGTASASLPSPPHSAAAAVSSVVSARAARKIGDEENVLVSWIVSPSLFWLQSEREMEDATTSWSKDALVQLGCVGLKRDDRLTPGTKVMAPFNSPNDYYRASVLRNNAGVVKLNAVNGGQQRVEFVLVSYVDYGNAEFVAKESLYSMPEQLAQTPNLARPVRLFGFEPMDEEKRWSLAECERFEAQFSKFSTPEDKEYGTMRAVAKLEMKARDNGNVRETVSIKFRRSDGQMELLENLLLEDAFVLFDGIVSDFGMYASDSPKDNEKVKRLPTAFHRWKVAGVENLRSSNHHSESSSSDRHNVASAEQGGNGNRAADANPYANEPSGSANEEGSNDRRNCTVPPCEVTVPSSGIITFRVTAVTSPSDFYIVPLISANRTTMLDNDRYTEMHNAMDLYYNDRLNRRPVNFYQLSDDPICAVEDQGHWKRGQVTVAHANGDTCDVHLLDSGCKVTCNVMEICELKSEFAMLPIRAVRCSLFDVAPDADGWSDRATGRFKGFTQGVILRAVVIDANVPLMLSVMPLDSEVPFNEQLKEEGLARPG